MPDPLQSNWEEDSCQLHGVIGSLIPRGSCGRFDEIAQQILGCGACGRIRVDSVLPRCLTDAFSNTLVYATNVLVTVCWTTNSSIKVNSRHYTA